MSFKKTLKVKQNGGIYLEFIFLKVINFHLFFANTYVNTTDFLY